ncbi:prepilin-type N-terminal cleavage/methylation domain-containing protein [Vallitaleaceae bacterium 9-2]
MKKLTKHMKKNEGFTLMEIIIVIVILGILALIAVPRLIGFTTQAEIAADKEYAAVVARAAELYWAANEQPAAVNITDIDTSNGAGLVEDPGAVLQDYTAATVTMGTGTYEGVASVQLSGSESDADPIFYNSIDGYTAAAFGQEE